MLSLIISWLCVLAQVLLFAISLAMGLFNWWFILTMLIVCLVYAIYNTVIYLS